MKRAPCACLSPHRPFSLGCQQRAHEALRQRCHQHHGGKGEQPRRQPGRTPQPEHAFGEPDGAKGGDAGDQQHTGIPASALRYYEEKGLIASLRDKGERRRYAPGVLDQLALIALGQAAGLTLDEIRTMLTPEGGPDVDRQLLLPRPRKSTPRSSAYAP